MTDEQLLRKLDELAASLEQTLADVNAIRHKVRSSYLPVEEKEHHGLATRKVMLREWWANLPA